MYVHACRMNNFPHGQLKVKITQLRHGQLRACMLGHFKKVLYCLFKNYKTICTKGTFIYAVFIIDFRQKIVAKLFLNPSAGTYKNCFSTLDVFRPYTWAGILNLLPLFTP